MKTACKAWPVEEPWDMGDAIHTAVNGRVVCRYCGDFAVYWGRKVGARCVPCDDRERDGMLSIKDYERFPVPSGFEEWPAELGQPVGEGVKRLSSLGYWLDGHGQLKEIRHCVQKEQR